MHYELKPNLNWPASQELPVVDVCCNFAADVLRFTFDVSEPESCFRSCCTKNGDPCWQDSCVEVFLNSPMHGGYYNFECSCAGVCLAEFGQGRAPRRQFESSEYEQFSLKVLSKPNIGGDGRYHWSIEVSIPRALVGIRPDDVVFGNLYKCASAAANPHYLMAFPIQSQAPDFHRPEFFRTIDGSSVAD